MEQISVRAGIWTLSVSSILKAYAFNYFFVLKNQNSNIVKITSSRCTHIRSACEVWKHARSESICVMLFVVIVFQSLHTHSKQMLICKIRVQLLQVILCVFLGFQILLPSAPRKESRIIWGLAPVETATLCSKWQIPYIYGGYKLSSSFFSSKHLLKN